MASGISALFAKWRSRGVDDSTLEENLRRIASVPLLYTPGTQWKYSIGTDVLGAVIAKVTEKPLQEAIHSLVTKPLGMDDTGFTAVDPERLTTAYVNDVAVPRRMRDSESLPFLEGTVGFRLAPAGCLFKFSA